MSFLTDFMAQISSKDAILSYSNPTLKTPIIIAGSGINEIITFDNNGEIDVGNYKVTADGATVAGVKPGFLKGKLKLQYLAPARVEISRIQMNQFNASFVVPGQTLIITSPSGQWTSKIPNLMFTGIFGVPDLTEDGVGEVTISFSGGIPNSLTLGNITTAASSILAL